MKKICWLGCLFFMVSSLDAIVILVHGTFAKKDKWHQKGGDFYTAYTQTNTLDSLYSFTWSGKLSPEAHIKAAHQLCEFIIKQPYDEEKTLIGHSHGGSVINIASHLLDTLQYAVQQDYQPLAEKLDQLLKIFTLNPYYLREDFPYSYTREFECDSDDPAAKEAVREYQANATRKAQERSEQNLYKKITDSVEALSGMLLEVNGNVRFVKKRYVMNRVQLLATPVLVGNYYPNMSIVRHAEHYYSLGDWIQKIGGQMVHEYPFHNRLAQIEVCFAVPGKPNAWVKPDHSGLHHPLMGYWLGKSEVIDQNVVLGKHHQLLLYSDASGFTCKEKTGDKK